MFCVDASSDEFASVSGADTKPIKKDASKPAVFRTEEGAEWLWFFGLVI